MKRNVHAFRIHRAELLQRYSFALLQGYFFALLSGHRYSWMQLLCILLYTAMHCWTMDANTVCSQTLFYTLVELQSVFLDGSTLHSFLDITVH